MITSNNRQCTTARGNAAKGFVLVATLWILVSLTLIAAFVGSQLEILQRETLGREVLQQQKLDQMAIESGILYLAATRRAAYGGLQFKLAEDPSAGASDPWTTVDPFIGDGEEIRLDGRTYLGRGDIRIALQDAGSLISLRSDRLEPLRQLLAGYGLDYSDRDRLLSALQDYTDRDNTPGVSGAEEKTYRDQGLLPPTNRYLSNPYQLYNVVGWTEFLDAHPEVFREVTIYVADRENFNTMRPVRLSMYEGLDQQDIERLLQFRKDSVFTSIAEVNEVSGTILQIDPSVASLVPSSYLQMRLTLPQSSGGESFGGKTTGEESHREEWIGVTMTSGSQLAPWEIDYRLNVPKITLENSDDTDSRYIAEAAPTPLLR